MGKARFVPTILDFANLRLTNDLRRSDVFRRRENPCKLPEEDCILRESCNGYRKPTMVTSAKSGNRIAVL